MTWSAVLGQPLAVSLLQRACDRNQVAHAYLFHGVTGVGKGRTAQELAAALACTAPAHAGGCGSCVNCKKVQAGNHPDVLVMQPDGRAIKLDQVRELQRQLYSRPTEGSWRVAIIDGAERMTVEASNAVLKLLEEPPHYVRMVLLTPTLGQILPTIVSRCQVISFQPLMPEMIAAELVRQGIAADRAILAASLGAGSLGRAWGIAQDDALMDRRATMLELIQKASVLDEYELLGWAERLEKQKGDLEMHLEVLMSLLRDALFLAAKADPALVIHMDLLPELLELSAQIGLTRLMDMTQRAMEAAGHLRRNANVRLTMDWLCLHLGLAS